MGQTNGCDIRLPLTESFYFKDGKKQQGGEKDKWNNVQQKKIII